MARNSKTASVATAVQLLFDGARAAVVNAGLETGRRFETIEPTFLRTMFEFDKMVAGGQA